MSKLDKIKKVYNGTTIINGTRQLVSKILYKKSFQSQYKKWIEKSEPDKAELSRQRKHEFKNQPLLSVVVPMYNTNQKYFAELIDSLKNQTYAKWELCLADGSPKKDDYFENYVKDDKRIKYKFLNKNGGISENTNAAIEFATGDFIVFSDHDDLLPAFAFYEIVKAINDNPDADYIYSDEDKIEAGVRKDPHFKSDYSPETLLGQNYISHLSVVSAKLLKKVGPLRKKYDGAQDFDFTLRATHQAKQVVHIPKVLYHWRICEGSTAKDFAVKQYAIDAGKNAIKDFLNTLGIKSNIHETMIPGIYNAEILPEKKPLVSIITKKTSILTAYERYELIDSLEKAKGEYVIYVDEAIEIKNNDFVEKMLGYAMLPEVAFVGAKIIDRNNNYLSAGVKTGKKAGYILSGKSVNMPWYFGYGMCVSDASAIAPVLVMAKREYFTGGDIISLCEKAVKNGKRNVYCPAVEVVYDGKLPKINASKQADRYFSTNIIDHRYRKLVN